MDSGLVLEMLKLSGSRHRRWTEITGASKGRMTMEFLYGTSQACLRSCLQEWNPNDDGVYTEWDDALGNMQLLCIDDDKSGNVSVPVTLLKKYGLDIPGKLSIRLVNRNSNFDVTLNLRTLKFPEPILYSDVAYYVFKPSDYKVK